MRILQINTTCNSGSTGKIAYDIHKCLVENGHESLICFGRGKEVSDAFKFNNKFGVAVDAVLSRITGLNSCFSYFATRRLLKKINEFNPDIVHIHNIHGYYVNMYMVFEFLKKNNIKTVVTMHDEFLYTGKCGCTYSCNKWLSRCCRCDLLQDYPRSMFFDKSEVMWMRKKELFENFTDAVFVTPSEWLLGRAKKSAVMKNLDIRRIPNGIDVSIFKIAEKSKKNNKLILFVAPNAMNEHKGGKYFVKLATYFPEYNFVMIGAKDVDFEHPDNLVVMKRTENQNELSKYYSEADALVICSASENFPTVCLEALCCGTPVLGFDVGGCMETIGGKYGVFVPYGDVEALAQNLENVMNMKKQEEISEFGKKMYSKELMVSNYLELYRGIL